VNIALPAIQQGAAGGSRSTQWIVNAYLLCWDAFCWWAARPPTLRPAAGFPDRHRAVHLGLYRMRLSPDIKVLVAAGGPGSGAALLTPASLAMLGANFDAHERSRAIELAGVGALTAAAGPCWAWLVDHVSWRQFSAQTCAGHRRGRTCMFACEIRDPRPKPLDWKERGYRRDRPAADHLRLECDSRLGIFTTGPCWAVRGALHS